MSNIEIFENKEFGKVQTMVIDGEPWFVGKDVLIILGYSDLTHGILDHVDEDDRVNSKTQGLNDPELGQRGGWLINESGLYSLILTSKLPTAKKFKHWVTSEVLPAIRKTGSYNLPQDYLSALKALVVSEEEKQKLLAENTNMKPKAEFYDAVTGSVDTIDIKSAAKVLNIPNIGRNKLFAFLREKNILNKRNEPYQYFIDRGYFRQVESRWERDGTTHINLKTVVFQKGLDFIRDVISKELTEKGKIDVKCI